MKPSPNLDAAPTHMGSAPARTTDRTRERMFLGHHGHVLSEQLLFTWCRNELGASPGGPGEAASIAQTADFLSAYQAAAGVSWTDRHVQLAWAAGLWVRLSNAKKDAARGGGPQLDRLGAEVSQRLARAGL